MKQGLQEREIVLFFIKLLRNSRYHTIFAANNNQNTPNNDGFTETTAGRGSGESVGDSEGENADESADSTFIPGGTEEDSGWGAVDCDLVASLSPDEISKRSIGY